MTTCEASPRWQRFGLDELLVVATLALAFAMNLRPLDDPDLWWHLRTGEWILAHGAVPWVDVFSSIAAGREWLAYSWLPEIGLALLARHGFHLLSIAGALAATVVAAALLHACRRTGARWRATAIAVLAAVTAASICGPVRPHVLSFLFFVVLLPSTVLGRPRRRRLLAWPLVLGMWANCHVFFPFGLALIGLRLTEDGWRAATTRHSERAARVLALEMLAAVVAVGATLATPYGWHLWRHLVTLADQPTAMANVVELRSLDFRSGYGLVAAAYVTLAGLALATARVRLATRMAFFLFLAAGLHSARGIPFFAFVAAPVLAAALERHGSRLLAAPVTRARPRATAAALHYALAVVGAVVLAAHVPRDATLDANVPPDKLPLAAARVLTEFPPGTRLLNTFNWGGFLLYVAGDRTPVAMDGRTQVYGETLLQRHLTAERGLPGWREYVATLAPEVVLWPADRPLASLLAATPGWRERYRDSVAVIFVRDIDGVGRDEVRSCVPRRSGFAGAPLAAHEMPHGGEHIAYAGHSARPMLP